MNIDRNNILPRKVSGVNPVDHGALIGLGDDDHPQYITHAEGNATYSLLGHTHLLSGITDVTITAINLNTLDDGVNSALHFHDADRARANHTGTQLSATISDFNETAQDAVGGILTNGGGLTWTYNDIANTISAIVSISSASVTDFSEAVDDRVASLLVAGSNIGLNYNDVGNTLTVSVINNPSFSGSVTLGDEIGDSHLVNGNLVIIDNSNTGLRIAQSAGGDLIMMGGGAATTGSILQSTNSAQTDFEPFEIFAEYISIRARTDVLTATEIIRINSTNITIGNNARILASDGSAATPSYSFANDSDTGFFSNIAGRTGWASNGLFAFRLTENTIDILGTTGEPSIRLGAASNVVLTRDAANTLAQRNGLDAQAFRIYNTFTDAVNYARLNIHSDSGGFYIDQEYAGTGTVRDVYIGMENGTTGWHFKGTTRHLFASVDNIYDIGASGASRPRTGYFGTSIIVSGAAGSAIGAASSSTTNLNLAAGIAGVSSLRISHGVAPTTPVDGDVWTTTASMFARINGVTVDLGTAGGSYTDEQAQDAVGTILVDSASIGFTYTDATPSITAIVNPNLTLTSLIVNGTVDINISSDDTLLNLTSTGVGSTVGIGLNIPTDSWTVFIGAITEELIFRHSSSVAMDLIYLTNVGSVIAGHKLALATNATNGFLYIPSSAGVPTGTPTSHTGKVPIEFDTTNNRLYVYDGSWLSFVRAYRSVIELGSDVASIADTVFQNVTGLSFAVTSGVNYRVHCVIMYTTSATSVGVRFGFTGPTMTHMAKYVSFPDNIGANLTHFDGSTAADAGIASTTSMSVTDGNIALIDFVFRPSANGTFQLRFAPEVATASGVIIEAGSTLEWW